MAHRVLDFDERRLPECATREGVCCAVLVVRLHQGLDGVDVPALSGQVQRVESLPGRLAVSDPRRLLAASIHLASNGARLLVSIDVCWLGGIFRRLSGSVGRSRHLMSIGVFLQHLLANVDVYWRL